MTRRYDGKLSNHTQQLYLLSTMGLVRLRIREFAAEKGWTLKEVSDLSGVGYSALKIYVRSPGLATIDVLPYINWLGRLMF